MIPNRPPLAWEVLAGRRAGSRATSYTRHHRWSQPRRPHRAAGAARARTAHARRRSRRSGCGPGCSPPSRVSRPTTSHPRCARSSVEAIGGSVPAEHSDFAGREVLGTSTGQARPEVRHAAPRPCCPRERRDGRRWSTPTQSTDVDRGARLRRLAPERQALRLGQHHRRGSLRPADPLPGRVATSARRRPARGCADRRHELPVRWWRGGQRRCRARSPGCARRSRTSIASRTCSPAIGGVDAETVDNAKARGPQTLRAGARAVTVEDFERLAAEADPAIARVRCLPPIETGGPIRMLLVPKVERPGDPPPARRLRPARRHGGPRRRASRRAADPRLDDRDRHALLPGGHRRRARGAAPVRPAANWSRTVR